MILAGISAHGQPPSPTPTQEQSPPAPQTSPPKQGQPAEPARFVRYADTGVYHVRNETKRSANPETDACVAGRDDVITIYVKHMHSWLKDPLVSEHLPNNAKGQ